jgi:hypothetical protein
MEASNSCLSLDFPRIELARASSVQAYRLAKENHEKIFGRSSYERPKSRHEIATKGYTGYIPKVDDNPEMESPVKFKIRGYTGHIPGSLSVCGKAIVPSEEVQYANHAPQGHASKARIPVCKFTSRIVSVADTKRSIHGDYLSPVHRDFLSHRTTRKDLLQQRYENAVASLLERKQTQRGLLSIIQSKLSERVKSYSEQAIRTRKFFEYFDYNGNMCIDEFEFRDFLEINNCYLDDVQRLALFAYFDTDFSGGLSWEQFRKSAMVPNPKGGTAVLPKSITRNDEAPESIW